ncbi:MAG: Trm112 family protein [Fimbriimonadaceae bacterium]
MRRAHHRGLPGGCRLIEPTLLELLACPCCADRPPLRQEADCLACDSCKRKFPVKDGIPNLLVEEDEE